MKIGRHCHDVALLLASFDGEEGSDAKTKPHNNKLAPGDDLGASSCMDHDVSHGEHHWAGKGEGYAKTKTLNNELVGGRRRQRQRTRCVRSALAMFLLSLPQDRIATN
mmetsp:Transcript_58449/g.124002  ORF Transcript_58449/g.124002 Transcript_58449/m.124002 type:complete len:108 (-) Transcript_58449:631-954(-)